MTDHRPIRTRFAPSPTGDLHLGSVRTALFSWLYARHHNGVFVLRIEDTDRARSTQASVDAILEGMNWLGLDYDEGPFYQTKRLDQYQAAIHTLLEKDLAYRCDCTPERLETIRDAARNAGEKPRYDGHCAQRQLTSTHSKPTVIRFRNPTDGAVTFDDAVRGTITIQNAELDDLIIARSDGTPTYNLSVVIDDRDMAISHVIRGDDHINNTPRQINLLQALGAAIPTYAHVPMILGPTGKRLSKRDAATNILQYRDEGFLPQALLNGLARLGWSHGDQERFSLEEMIQLFSLSAINRSGAVFNEEKLLWFNQQYLQACPANDIAPLLADQLHKQGVTVTDQPTLTDVVCAQASRSKTIKEMADKSRYFYEDVDTFDEKAAKKHLTEQALPALIELHQCFLKQDNWTTTELHELIKKIAQQHNLGFGKIAQPLRVALTGNTTSPSIDQTLLLIGKHNSTERIARAIHYIQQKMTETAE